MDNRLTYEGIRELSNSLPKLKPVFTNFIIHKNPTLWGALVIKNLHFTDLSLGVSILDKQPRKIKVKVPEAGYNQATYIYDIYSGKSDIIHALEDNYFRDYDVRPWL